MSKTTLVIGASNKPERYAYKAVTMLRGHGIPVRAIGTREATIGDVEVLTGLPAFEGLHTVTLYVGPANQAPLYDYVLSLKPQRVIFNPGTENPEFQSKLQAAGIGFEEACTLVMLSTGVF